MDAKEFKELLLNPLVVVKSAKCLVCEFNKDIRNKHKACNYKYCRKRV